MMTQIIEILIAQLSIWAPALVATLGIVTAIIGSVNRAKDSWADLKKDTDFKEIKIALKESVAKNTELIKYNKLLLEEITKIKGYTDYKEAEADVQNQIYNS